jgi:hypothetical protein
VNIAGARGEKWDGPYADNFSQDIFDLIVETVRGIIDAVKPTRTFYTLEPMPYIFPDSADGYQGYRPPAVWRTSRSSEYD